MQTRIEATTKYAQAPKKVKGQILATVAVIDRLGTKPRKYYYDAINVLQYVWPVSGGLSGKYLAASMSDWAQGLETRCQLVAVLDCL